MYSALSLIATIINCNYLVIATFHENQIPNTVFTYKRHLEIATLTNCNYLEIATKLLKKCMCVAISESGYRYFLGSLWQVPPHFF
jgi:hypothetical protein